MPTIISPETYGTAGFVTTSPTSSSASLTSHEMETEDQEHFEGAEKNLEMDFRSLSHAPSNGCRALTAEQLKVFLDAANCRILSSTSNTELDSYVLSESSLFVYPRKIILKTCGTTTLLHCVPHVLRFTRALGMEMEWLSYSRKNFAQPEVQPFPHASFNQEVGYLNDHMPTFPGAAYVLGPVSSDHWFVYVWDNCDAPSNTATDRTIHVLMQDLPDSVSQLFYAADRCGSRAEGTAMTTSSGLHEVVPMAALDAYSFAPCGYSCNALQAAEYHTIHITPESHCSYASWETNATPASYQRLLDTVLRIFQPGRFTMTLFADQAALTSLETCPFSATYGAYKQTSQSQTTFEGDYVCTVANYHHPVSQSQKT